MDDYVIKLKVLSGIFWKLAERGGTQGIQLIVQIVLARLLLPSEYGIVALIMVFITIANVFITSGFQMALIQKKDADETDFSSVFFMSLCIAGLLYIIMFLTAPFIATFFEEPQLISLLRVLSVILFLGVFNSIQNAVISRNLLFKKLFYSSLSAVTISGVLGVILAYSGYGAWALVCQQLTNQLLITIVLWFTLRWRPKLLLSLKRLTNLFSFGWKVLVVSFIHQFHQDLRSLIIGKMYDSAILGFYNRGLQFPALIVTNISDSIMTVTFPVLASQQDNRQKVKSMLRRSIITSTFIIFPMMFGLAAIAEPLVIILLTERWLPAVPFLQIFCFTYAFWPLHTANFTAINALGRSDITLKIGAVMTIISILILSVTVFYGVYAIAIGGVISGFISTLLNIYPNRKLLGYGYIELWKDIMPSLLLSMFMGVTIYCIHFLNISTWITLIVQISIGLFLYYFMANLFNVDSYQYLISTYQDYLHSKKGNNLPLNQPDLGE